MDLGSTTWVGRALLVAGLVSGGASCSSKSDPVVAQPDIKLPVWASDAKMLVPGLVHDQEQLSCRSNVCRHNENTDLIVFRGAIYFVFRTARSQVLGPNCSLHVMKSVDGGKNFALESIIEGPNDRDFRDPHFFVKGDELFIHAITRLPVNSDRDSNVQSISVVTHSADGGKTWAALTNAAPPTWSFWRVQAHAGVFYSAAYEDGDKSVSLFSSTDGLSWTQGAQVYGIAEDTPLETELTFMPSGKVMALVRTDGNDEEYFGDKGRLRTQVCWSDVPYTKFDCPQTIDGQRLDGPVTFFHGSRLFHVGRKHLQPSVRKRTALYEITGNFAGGPIAVNEVGELPSSGDTAYAGVATIDANHSLVTWYSSDLSTDPNWILAILGATDIWQATIDFTKL